MEILVCYCLQCKAELARFSNLWDAIGTNYHSPVNPPISVVGLEATGASYGAAPESTIEHSSLQDIACIKCQTILGLQCYSAPPGHLLMKDQLILNLALMSVVSEGTSRSVQISVLKTIPLVKPSGKRTGASRRSSTAQPVRPNSHSMPPPPRPPVPSFNASTPKFSTSRESRLSLPSATVYSPSEVDKFKSWAEIAIRNQKNEIERVSGTLDRVERDMELFKEFIVEIRTDLAASRESRSRDQEKLERLRNRVEENERRPRSSGGNVISNRSLEAITEDILQVNQKANEVDEVKEEVKNLRARLSELEQMASDRAVAQPQNATPESSTKRNHDHVNDLSTPARGSLSPPKRPSKRRRVSNKSSMNESPSTEHRSHEFRVHFGTPELVELRASEHRALSLVDLPNDPEADRAEIQDDTAVTDFAVEPEPISRPRLRSSRTKVSTPGRPGEATTPGQKQLQDTIASKVSNRRRKSNGNFAITTSRVQGPRRNSEGFLLRPDGETDRRSLLRKNEAVQKEDEGPDQQKKPSSPPAVEATQVDEDARIDKDVERDKGPDYVETADDPLIAADEQPNEDTHESINDRHAEIVPSVEVERATPAQPRRMLIRTSTPVLGRKFKCGSCNNRYSTFHALDYHHENTPACADRSNDETPSRPTADKPFRCGVCGKRYTSLNALDYHHKHSAGCDSTENDSFPTCPSCGKIYKAVFRLERHIETGACNLNDYSLGVDSSLQICNACGKPFKTRLELEEHKCSRVKLHSLNFREASLAAREVALIERERLVRRTLELELGDLRNK